MQNILVPVGILGAMGVVFAALLGFASKIFHVEVDHREELVREALPGANCGACGYPGCDGYAKAVAEGTAPINLCLVGGKSVADEVADIMGVERQEMTHVVAKVHCNGTYDNTELLFDYEGVKDCRIIKNLGGGSCKACQYSCQGCGTCKTQCEYGAISLVNGVAVIDEDKCVACKKCINVCPQRIISLVPYGEKAVVNCSNRSFGKQVKDDCKVGCIGCTLCTKMAPDHFEMDGKLARAKYDAPFDYEAVKKAADKCPAKCIKIIGHEVEIDKNEELVEA